MADVDSLVKRATYGERKRLQSPVSDSSERELDEAFRNTVNGDSDAEVATDINESVPEVQAGWVVETFPDASLGVADPNFEEAAKLQHEQQREAPRLSPVEIYDPAKHSPPLDTLSPKGKRLRNDNQQNGEPWLLSTVAMQSNGDDRRESASLDTEFGRERSDWDKPRRVGNMIEMPVQTYRQMQLELDRIRLELRLLADRNVVLTSENAKLRSKLVESLKRRTFVTVPSTVTMSNSTNASGTTPVSVVAPKIVEPVVTYSSKRSVVDVHGAQLPSQPHSPYHLRVVPNDRTNDTVLGVSNGSSRSASPTSSSTSWSDERDVSHSNGNDRASEFYTRSRVLRDSLRTLSGSPTKSVTAVAYPPVSLARREAASWMRSRYGNVTRTSSSTSPTRYTTPLSTSTSSSVSTSSAYRNADASKRWNTERDTTTNYRLRQRPYAPKHHSDVRVGDEVKFAHRGEVGRARVRFVGNVAGETRTHVGLELWPTLLDDDSSEAADFGAGDGDGAMNGVRYFRTAPNRALFLPTEKILLVL